MSHITPGIIVPKSKREIIVPEQQDLTVPERDTNKVVNTRAVKRQVPARKVTKSASQLIMQLLPMPDSMNENKIALLIAAHNEELVLENTIQSAISAGMNPRHIYVVDDNSNDKTSEIAISVLGKRNVRKVARSGKGGALMKGIRYFRLTKRYEWIHIADADGAFGKNYFDILRLELDPRNAAATGYIKSLPGGVISKCRVYEYGLGMEVMRRFQNLFNLIPIIPGATSCFRSDVMEKVDFNTGSMTEDFDVTIQLHRQKMGKIQFVPGAVAFTQDPKDLSDYIKQVNRWNRGFMQVMRRHKLGLNLFRSIDLYMAYQLIVSFFYIFNLFIWLPLLILTTKNVGLLSVMFLADVLFSLGLLVFIAGQVKRWDILAAFPHIYAMRWLNMFLFIKAFVEVAILRKYRVGTGQWGTSGRRYKPTATPSN